MKEDNFRNIFNTREKNIKQLISYWQEICEKEPDKAKQYSKQINDAISKNDFFKLHLLAVESMGIKFQYLGSKKNIDDFTLLLNNLKKLEGLVKGQSALNDKGKGGSSDKKPYPIINFIKRHLNNYHNATNKDIFNAIPDELISITNEDGSEIYRDGKYKEGGEIILKTCNYNKNTTRDRPMSRRTFDGYVADIRKELGINGRRKK